MRSTITYFEEGGETNLEAVLDIVSERFKKGDIKAIVLASTFGKTALAAAERFISENNSLLIIGEVLDGEQSPPQDICQKLATQGHRVIWGLPMGQMSKFSRENTPAVIADAYKRISEGFKVACEIVLIASNSGYLKKGDKVISIAGTHSGADTAIVAKAAGYEDFKSFEVLEILCKPYQRSAV